MFRLFIPLTEVLRVTKIKEARSKRSKRSKKSLCLDLSLVGSRAKREDGQWAWGGGLVKQQVNAPF